ncbi:hypothetical protein O181_020828 [Austropuccinia psidii MF-1]|uniref:Uncharacterized protein n=1 Tax=Austropuccinia psidii MF-1 TaxID=1389203 RepID=A0A9Q3CC58_9BASI|nr:hypothetical protein [Austropuccinia psidii MF-1]
MFPPEVESFVEKNLLTPYTSAYGYQYGGKRENGNFPNIGSITSHPIPTITIESLCGSIVVQVRHCSLEYENHVQQPTKEPYFPSGSSTFPLLPTSHRPTLHAHTNGKNDLLVTKPHKLSHEIEHLRLDPSTFAWSQTSNRPIIHANKSGQHDIRFTKPHKISHSVEHLHSDPSTFPWSPTSNGPIIHAHKSGQHDHVVTSPQQLSHTVEHLHLTPGRFMRAPISVMSGGGSEFGALSKVGLGKENDTSRARKRLR